MPTSVKKRQPGLRIRAGSVREAREEAGVSLGKVAGTDLSRTAIFLIEKGKARPTMATLQLIADRTGKPLDFFLEDGAEEAVRLPSHRYDELERLMAQARFREAVALGRELLAAKPARDDEARLRTVIAQAHIRLQEPNDAAAMIAPARRYYELTSNKWMQLECRATEVAVLIEREDARAQEEAEAALKLARSFKPLPADMEMRMLQRVAIAAMINRNWDRAIAAYEELVALAESFHDIGKMALVYADLANVYQETGELELATRYSRRAIAAHEMIHNEVGLAMAENNLGVAMVKLGRPDAAEQHVGRALELLNGAGVSRQKAQLTLSLAEVRLAQGRLDEARAECEEAIQLATAANERITLADGHIWLAKVEEALGDTRAADAEFETAIDIFKSHGATERELRAHNDYAAVLEARGDARRAVAELRQVVALSRPDLMPRTREAESALSALA
jgi:tetratricopeptide (TPR) repeat protein